MRLHFIGCGRSLFLMHGPEYGCNTAKYTSVAGKPILSLIVSPGHSGQTWLSLLIGSHSQALSLGEIAEIYGQRDLSKCCQLCGEECEFWGEFNKVWTPEENIFSQLGRFSGKRILSVSKLGQYSKQIAQKNILVKVIRLIRDGRATTASFFRKYPARKYEELVRQWVSSSEEGDVWTSGFSPENRMVLRYEDLVQDTTSELKRVCDFLGVDFELGMVVYWKVKHHVVDGNLGTLSFVQRHFGMEFTPVDRDFYAQQDPISFRDERWRNELSAYDCYVFEKIGGQLNRQYGYTPIKKPFNIFLGACYFLIRVRRRLQRAML